MNKLLLDINLKSQKFLNHSQEADGRFRGWDGQPNDNVFFTALILNCLQNVPGTLAIRRKAATFLLQNKSATWTWNYWQRGSESMQQRQYPDDLDDTAVVLAGLLQQSPDVLTPEAHFHLKRNLAMCADHPGGPYTTWLITSQDDAWRDVDVAVNANIGWLLHLMSTSSREIEDYIDSCLQASNLQSPYYVGTAPTLYFLARWYRGAHLNILKQQVSQHLAIARGPLELALLLSAAAWLGCADEYRLDDLLGMQQDGVWPPEPLYYEPPLAGQRRHAASSALTTAFALEAMNVTIRPRGDVVNMAGIMAEAGGWEIDYRVLQDLNEGSWYGWQAYTIYDDILDGDADLTLLGMANQAMRQSLLSFHRATNNIDFQMFVESTFDTIDDANTWELRHARDPQSLPDYDYHQLAARSWGHCLAPTGVLITAGYKMLSPEVNMFHSFFRHYLIARQLADDAHDRRSDMAAGRMSAVVTLMKQGNSPSKVSQLIRHHVSEAQQALQSCAYIVDPAHYQGWLGRLMAMCEQVEAV